MSKIENSLVLCRKRKNMRVLPLIYSGQFTDDEIAENECSDRIWCSPAQFRTWTDTTEEGVATLLHLTNEEAQTTVGCIFGVHHSEETDIVFIPNWMYQELGDGTIIAEKAQPSLCTNLVLQPHTSEHLAPEIEDPQELLRDAFERYSCLTPGTTIPLWIGKQITVTIAELGPIPNRTLCIRNCELSLDLLRPLDMPEATASVATEAVTETEAVAEVAVAEVAVAEVAVAESTDSRPRHVILAEAARKRLAAQKIES
jgi:hypothetical protein